jgi:putative Ca2+/H+ antiporter (TMEM165/GDT1 family)
MAIACAAGQVIASFPTTIKDITIAVLFLGGAAYLLFVPEKAEEEKGEEEGSVEKSGTWWKELTVAFSVIFVGEFGDITQIQAANLTAKTHLPIAVFFASSIGLILVEIVGVYGGQFLVKKFSLQKIRYAGGAVFAGLGIYAVVKLIAG